MKRIEYIVAKYNGISIKEIRLDVRDRRFARPRQISMSLCRELTKHSLSEVGTYFNNRHHTTVLAASRQIRKLCLASDSFNLQYEIQKQLVLSEKIKFEEKNPMMEKARVGATDIIYLMQSSGLTNFTYQNLERMVRKYAQERFLISDVRRLRDRLEEMTASGAIKLRTIEGHKFYYLPQSMRVEPAPDHDDTPDELKQAEEKWTAAFLREPGRFTSLKLKPSAPPERPTREPERTCGISTIYDEV
jgi:hypothetical protein